MFFTDRVRATLGYGSYGTVVRAEDRFTGSAVAIKLLHKDEDLNSDLHVEERMYQKLLAGCDPHIECVHFQSGHSLC